MNADYRDRGSAEAAPEGPAAAPGSDLGPVAPSEIESRCEVVSEPQHGERLDKVLVAMAPEFSRNYLQWLIEERRVRVDGVAAASASRRMRCGQRVSVELWPTQESRAFRAEAMALQIVFEDDDLLVVDKPAGIVVHPAAGNWSGTLLNGLLAHHSAAALLPRAGIVHRLDKDTSGLMVVGKSLVAVTSLVRDIAARAVRREYQAIAHGSLAAAALSIDAPVGRDPQARVRMAIVASGKPARTDVRRIAVGAGCSALRCLLHTGRTHQIRVHLAAQGHPLVGDGVYGGRPLLGMQRQALHAARLAFEHPLRRTALVFEAAPPVDFAGAWLQVAGVA